LAKIKSFVWVKKHSNIASAALLPRAQFCKKLWKYIKDSTIKNKFFEVLSDLEDEVCQFLSELEIDVVRIICGGC